MRILLWHGYLLGGTGSNVYTRALAREWSHAGHDVTVVCQERHPERYDLGGARDRRAGSPRRPPARVRARPLRGAGGPAAPGLHRGGARALRRGERGRAARPPAGRPRLREPRPARRAGRRASGARFAVKAHGSELEYSMRGRPELERWGAESLARADAVFVGSAHIRAVLEDVVGHVERVHEVPPGVDVEEFRPEERAQALAGLLAEARARPAQPGQRRRAASPDEGNAERFAAFFASEEPTVVYVGKLIENKGVHVLLEALRGLDVARGRRRLRRLPRRARGAGAAGHALHRAARAPAPRPPAPALRRRRRPVDLPRGVRHGRRRGGGRGRSAARRRALGPRRGRGRHRARVPAGAGGTSSRPRPATPPPCATAWPSCSRCRRRSGARSGSPPGAPSSATGAGHAWPSGCSSRLRLSCRLRARLPRMGEEQKVGYEELLAASRAAFEQVPDFTLAVEEEFALLDPSTLGLVNRFEELQQGGEGHGARAAPRRRADRLRDRGAHRPLRHVRRARPTASASGARSCARSRTASASRSASTGTHPWSPWQEQRIIDTPHYRRNDELLRYVVWRNNTFGLHVHVGINGPDRAIRVTSALRNYLPELLAALRELPVRRGRVHAPPLGAHADLHPHVPALRHPGLVRGLGRLGGVRSLPLRDGLGHRAHADLVERAAASRLPDGRDPDLRRAARAERSTFARRALLLARGAHRPRARRGRAAAVLAAPAARGEPLARDPATGCPAS